MPETTQRPSTSENCRIIVAGDICLDVVGILKQRPGASGDNLENWRLTGEIRTHYLRGGALLLSDMIEAAVGSSADVFGPVLHAPAALAGGKENVFLDSSMFPRLTREEIVHSLITAGEFRTSTKADKNDKTVRVSQTHGFSGPIEANPSLSPVISGTEPGSLLVLDDTGNNFRKTMKQWDPLLESGPCLIIYKLHSPLPTSKRTNDLWNTVCANHSDKRVAIISVTDLRAAGVPVSLGLSWERTALDVVWHLLNSEDLCELRESPCLIVRLGLDGAVLWLRGDVTQDRPDQAWLIYDPSGIEGSFGLLTEGTMVSCGSAFIAALVKHLVEAGSTSLGRLLEPMGADGRPERLLGAIAEGLCASRRLLVRGFGKNPLCPAYPIPDIFAKPTKPDYFLARHRIPIIRGTIEPDRNYWRLLESVFENRTMELDAAVALVATGKTKGTTTTEKEAIEVLNRVPIAIYGALRTYDRSEIENYRALHTQLRDYLCSNAPARPLSIGVFGPPGAGKSFGVKQVAESFKGQYGCKEVEDKTFNLALYRTADELAGAFHLIRDIALRGKVPLVFFDEFDTSLDGHALGWLRYFLAPMQDGEFLDRGAPHPIGQAIFIFAGGTCASFFEFRHHPGMNDDQFREVKGPDFLSRLRATLDIPSLNYLTARDPQQQDGKISQRPDSFNPYGLVAAFPCQAAILLRRASILAFNLAKKAPSLMQADKSLALCPEVLRALLHMPSFEHGNRSFEALLDMSHLTGATLFTPSLLPSSMQIALHANSDYLAQLVATIYPLPPAVHLALAKGVHEYYRKQKQKGPHDPANRALKEWDQLDPDLKESNLGQASEIAIRLRSVGLWLRKRPTIGKPNPQRLTKSRDRIEKHVEELAKAEHDRWVAQKRKQGWSAGFDTSDESKDDQLLLHNCLFPWEMLSEAQRDLDRVPVRSIPDFLDSVGYEIIEA